MPVTRNLHLHKIYTKFYANETAFTLVGDDPSVSSLTADRGLAMQTEIAR